MLGNVRAFRVALLLQHVTHLLIELVAYLEAGTQLLLRLVAGGDLALVGADDFLILPHGDHHAGKDDEHSAAGQSHPGPDEVERLREDEDAQGEQPESEGDEDGTVARSLAGLRRLVPRRSPRRTLGGVLEDPAFVPEVEGALVRMGQILRHMRRVDAVAFADAADFTMEDYRTPHALMVQPYPTEASPAQLAEATHVTRAAMTGRLDRLVAAGLVHREVDATDRRRVIVRPTADGRAAWNKYIFETMARDQQLLGALSHDDLVQLNGLPRKVMLSLDQRALDQRALDQRAHVSELKSWLVPTAG